jgi:hypothetical protein
VIRTGSDSVLDDLAAAYHRVGMNAHPTVRDMQHIIRPRWSGNSQAIVACSTSTSEEIS